MVRVDHRNGSMISPPDTVTPVMTDLPYWIVHSIKGMTISFRIGKLDLPLSAKTDMSCLSIPVVRN